MSSPLAIGAVSAVLRNLLDDAMINATAALGTTVKVSAVAPDTIKLAEDDPPQLNVFLYGTTPNSGWRNAALPTRDGRGDRVANTPLAIDLHYLISAYGQADCHAEILLGYAMHLLHERPVLDRAAIRRALNPSPLDVTMLPPAFQALAASDLADQAEQIKIAPALLSTDEVSKLWSATQAHFRPSAAYQVSVVLIEGTQPARSPLPVLSRGQVDGATQRDRGVAVTPDLLPPTPTLLTLAPPNGQNAARLGETVGVTGVRLSGTGARVRLLHRLVTTPIEIAVTPDAAGAKFSFVLPNDAAAQSAWPPGVWQLSLLVTPAGESEPRESNALPLLIAPVPVVDASRPGNSGLGLPDISVARGGVPPRVTVRIAARPQVRLEQRALLMLGAHQASARPRVAAGDLLEFRFPNELPAGPYFVRLRVDGIDSELLRRASGQAPVFDVDQQTTVPA